MSPPPASSPAPGDASLPALDPAAVREPPRHLGGMLRHSGPGIIVAATVVGAGELIATTTLGAQVGFAALWLVLASCLVKPLIQAELGRYVLATGDTGLEAANRIPGPRLRVGWLVWAWGGMMLINLLLIGAMFSGIAEVLRLMMPAVPDVAWMVGLGALTLWLLLGGSYRRIERLAMVMVGVFTAATLMAVATVIAQPGTLGQRILSEGFTFRLPGEGLATAVAVFGITGVGAAEMFVYPYWCLEKGYARLAGPRDGSAAWTARARGWIRVMRVDVGVSLLLYTTTTLGFYLLGAGVLHPRGVVPSSTDLLRTLSRIFTETLGPWALWLFFAGAIATLYSTVFTVTAAHARIALDMARLLRIFSADDERRRPTLYRRLVVAMTVVPILTHFVFASPVGMVIASGVAQAFLLPAIGFATVYLRHRRLPAEVRPGRFVTFALWATATLMAVIMAYNLALKAGLAPSAKARAGLAPPGTTRAQQAPGGGETLRFRKHVLDADLMSYGADVLDRAPGGVSEVVAVGASAIFWYGHEGENAGRHEIDRFDPDALVIHVRTADQDGDGDRDVFVAENRKGLILLYENPGAGAAKRQRWPRRVIDDRMSRTHAVALGDINRDGRLDLVTTGEDQAQPPDSVVWYEGPAAPRAPWTKHVLGPGQGGGHGHYPDIGDVDGDGRVDVVHTAKLGGWYRLWRQPADATQPWPMNEIATGLRMPTNIRIADVNADGRQDLVASQGHHTGVLWFQAPGWAPQVFDTTLKSPHALEVADLDRDGDVDVAVCAFESKTLAWFENDGQGGFRRHDIAHDQEAYDLLARDMDGDGDLDLLVAGRGSRDVAWYEQRRPSDG